ncbi:hypothetical protein CYMTET_53051 [Cymbomonas tetramitiformis]|uniref:Uncharacterized protein n=1 Tax=Cymbomonas tetramitiformis TaxID=36881 RepID=A0AAE0BHR0_9CHLO|nr:hypothetical protein CYMTET_53051 [Cymbomonas tetramitiformis]
MNLEKNKVVQVGAPLFIRKYTEFGKVMPTFPNPTVAPEPAPAVEQQIEAAALAGLYHRHGGVTALAQQYAMSDPTSSVWYDLVQWLDRRRTVDYINQHYPLWTQVKAQEVRDTHSACHLPFSDTPAEDEWLLPYVVPEASDISTPTSAGSISFSHISMALAETLYDRAAADLPCPGGYRQAMSLPDGPEWEAAITLREI